MSSDNPPASIGDNEAFVTLLHVAREDPDVRHRLLTLIGLDTFQRRSALNTYMDRMRLLGAPPEFVSAVAALTDDQIAAQARRLLVDLDD